MGSAVGWDLLAVDRIVSAPVPTGHGSDVGAGFACLHDCVEFHARRRPEHVAIDAGGEAVTYRDLADRTARLAGLLQERGVQPNRPVGFLLDNGVSACCALLGIMRAGGCYVPMTPNFPAGRVAAVMADAGFGIVISAAAFYDLLESAMQTLPEGDRPGTLIVLDDPAPPASLRGLFATVLGPEDLPAAPDDPAPAAVGPEDLAYIMYTSGTTGRPKGVMLRHRNVTAFLRWAVRRFGLTGADRIANHSRVTFDVSILDIFGAFFTGATLCPLTTDGERFMPGQFIVDRGVTVWVSVPSAIRSLIKLGHLGELAGTLRCGLFCGEALPQDYAAAWRDALPDVPIHNLYGPTEAAVACTSFEVGADGALNAGRFVPIGLPSTGTRIHVLRSDADVPAAPNEVGRLMIAGTQVGKGYWRRPDLTEAAFRVNPLAGNGDEVVYDTGDLAYVDDAGVLHFVGRGDTQVKVNGYRIELGEIEAVLAEHPQVGEAAVICLDGDPPVLKAAVSFYDRSAAAANGDLKAHCRAMLPAYMIPSEFAVLEDLPRNANDKIDRNALRDMLS